MVDTWVQVQGSHTLLMVSMIEAEKMDSQSGRRKKELKKKLDVQKDSKVMTSNYH